MSAETAGRAGRAEIDRIESEWEHLASLVSSSLPGWSRTGFSEEDRAARDWVLQRMRDAGLDARQDAAGNVIGYLEGEVPGAPDIVIGSHSDTVPGGGRFDGIVGVLGAIEVARMLRRSGTRLRRGLRVVDFANEEGNPQGVKLVGSRAVAGSLDAAALASRDAEGTTLAALMAGAGHRPEELASARWRASDIAAYLELHIEQGPQLEAQKADIGIVTSICGITTFSLEVRGRRDHAGTMPMDVRQDAMCCAADAVLAVRRVGSSGTATVGTVGQLTTPSPLTNTISEAATVTGEFRSPERAELETMQTAFARELAELDGIHRTSSALAWGHLDAPTPMDQHLSGLALAASLELGQETVQLYSGATHDGVAIAELAPSAMIFIPSRDGRSHCPEEWSDFADVATGIEVLLETVLRVDAAP
ncbi:M20 family metallo-hydrolase [Leucobacter allii]|uniref:M20 family metallo-hydrolase n=1 Tax=Leucobacter allii TaxID=2932247 RepID=UPI001FCFCDEA|nr:M20 family metallo-hydrolase [Leucobacter allii]UOR00583.1 M20 family metallo-hydrolase [Leucobacter allii]